MKYIKMQCAACGAGIKVKNGLKEVTCEYCRTKFVVDPKQFTSEEFEEYFCDVDGQLLETLQQDIDALKRLTGLVPREALLRGELNNKRQRREEIYNKNNVRQKLVLLWVFVAVVFVLTSESVAGIVVASALGALVYCFYPRVMKRFNREAWIKWRFYAAVGTVFLVSLFFLSPAALLVDTIAFGIAVCLTNGLPKKYEKQKSDADAELAEAERQYDISRNELEEVKAKQDLSYVAEKYRNIEALEYIYTALQSGSCKTISRAVNSYEDSKFREEMRESQRQQAETIRLQREEIQLMKKERERQASEYEKEKRARNELKKKQGEDENDVDMKKVLASAAIIGAATYKNRKKIARTGMKIIKEISKFT